MNIKLIRLRPLIYEYSLDRRLIAYIWCPSIRSFLCGLSRWVLVPWCRNLWLTWEQICLNVRMFLWDLQSVNENLCQGKWSMSPWWLFKIWVNMCAVLRVVMYVCELHLLVGCCYCRLYPFHPGLSGATFVFLWAPPAGCVITSWVFLWLWLNFVSGCAFICSLILHSITYFWERGLDFVSVAVFSE